jgi:7-cyano-7-deazaguanine synthase
MSMVTLASGGLDSTLVGILAKEKGIASHPLFIDYGQRASVREWSACRTVHARLKLPKPLRMDLSGFGRIIISGLTNSKKKVKKDAFTPNRNLLFLVCGAAYAHQLSVSSVAIGLLSEELSIFPDQRQEFLSHAEAAIAEALGRRIRVITPLSEFSKADVVQIAKSKHLSGTYSCHTGNAKPCGKCIACQEFRYVGRKKGARYGR